jgi:hypothetical protein
MRSTRLCTTAIASWWRSSLPEEITNLFAEYADAYARSERPRAEEYLARAGKDADELAGLLEGFLRAAPVGEPDQEAVAALESLLAAGEPPLISVRASRGVRVDEVVDALVERLGLDPAKRAKVKRYYQQLEGGLLEAGRVNQRVWAVLSDLVGSEVWQHAGWQPPREALAAAYYRADEVPATTPPPQTEEAERDEIDRLFLGDSR